MKPIAASLATEGALDEQVLRQLIAQSARQIAPGVCYGKRGRDHLKQNLPRFNQAAQHHPFIILADLEDDECAPALLREWLPRGSNPKLVFRIAVRMIESWLLADRQALAKFLGVPVAILPDTPDAEINCKARIIELARRSRLREIRQDVVPAPQSTSRIGKNYVGQLSRFALQHWQAKRAAKNSPSLAKAIRALRKFST